MLKQQPHKVTGAASSLITFMYMSIGALGTLLISQDWISRVFILDTLRIFYAIVSLVLWFVFSKRYKFLDPQISP